MTWWSINPKSVSDEVLQTAAYLLSNSHEHSVSADDAFLLSPDELADAFNILDPEVTQISVSPNAFEDEDEG
jgi:hypothetical protein